jgi:hypothetical protein
VSRLFDRRVTVAVDNIELTSLDVAFRVEKTLKPLPNTCELTIWNLNPDHRAQLEELRPKDKQATTGIPCRIDAGYKDAVSQIWLGDLRTVQTVRDGPDWVTELTSGDGEKAWKNARLHISYGPKTSIDTALRAMARALGVAPGNLSSVTSKLKIAGSAVFPTGFVISGSVARAITDLGRSADLDVSIQDGALQFLDRGKALAGEALRIAPETGMLGSPTVDNEGLLSVTVSMIPDVRCGGLIVMDAERVKGNYKIVKAIWTGDTSAEVWEVEIEAERY